MKDYQNYMEGVVVSEEETAKHLGFNSVEELRRWDTETGRKAADLEYALSQAKQEAECFRWHGRRMQAILEQVAPVLEGLEMGDEEHRNKLLLAINVVCGKQVSKLAETVDWKHILKDWLEPINEELREGKLKI
jgi:hypothetical protein